MNEIDPSQNFDMRLQPELSSNKQLLVDMKL